MDSLTRPPQFLNQCIVNIIVAHVTSLMTCISFIRFIQILGVNEGEDICLHVFLNGVEILMRSQARKDFLDKIDQ